LIEFKQIKEFYNNPTSKNVGFFYTIKTIFQNRHKKFKAMLRLIKTTKHISVIAIVALYAMSGGFEKGRSINLFSNTDKITNAQGYKSFDYQAIKPSCDFRNSKNERVKEIKCVFV
jgi:hypothetical protein